MVNVGGRSKGCSTCRRRRVKCDENSPICGRCQRGGFECDGPRDTAFIEGTIVRSRRSERRATASARRAAGDDTGSSSQSVPLSLPLIGFEFEIYVSYSRTYLRRGASIDRELQETQLADIIAAGTTAENGHIFHQAILSFSTVCFGTHHSQASVVNQGYAVQGAALQQLNKALSDSQCHTRDEVILSVAVMALLECVVPTGTKHYLEHMAGLERLLELRDPRSYCSPKSCNLYWSVRHMILMASLRTRRPSILARAEWKTILRLHCPDQDNPEQDLCDVLADCTVLAAECDKAQANWESNPEKAMRQRDNTKLKALDLLTYLRGWKTKWDSDEKNSHIKTSTPFATLDEMEEESVEHEISEIPPTFEFSSDDAAIMLILYDATLIYVLRILAALASLGQDDEPSKTSKQNIRENASDVNEASEDTKEAYTAAERLAALEVCSCIPRYEAKRSRADSDTSPIVHWAVPVALTTFRNSDSSEGRYMTALLQTKGGMIAKGLWGG